VFTSLGSGLCRAVLDGVYAVWEAEARAGATFAAVADSSTYTSFLVPRLVGWSAGKGRDDGEWFWFLAWLLEKMDSH